MIDVPEHVKVDDARNGLRLRGVERDRLAVAMRTASDDGIQHIRQSQVGAVLLSSRQHRLHVRVGHRRADQPEILLILERRLFGHGQFGRRVSKRSVREPSPGRGIDDMAVLRGKVLFRDSQFSRCGRHQHSPGRRTGLAHGRVVEANAQAAARELVVEARIPVGLLDPYGFPVDVEFLGNDHRQRGLHALAHFGILGIQGDNAIAADTDQRMQFRGSSGCQGGFRDADHEPETRCRTQAYEVATIDQDFPPTEPEQGNPRRTISPPRSS